MVHAIIADHFSCNGGCCLKIRGWACGQSLFFAVISQFCCPTAQRNSNLTKQFFFCINTLTFGCTVHHVSAVVVPGRHCQVRRFFSEIIAHNGMPRFMTGCFNKISTIPMLFFAMIILVNYPLSKANGLPASQTS